MPVISLTTDFGQKDGFIGAMKGVIWKICPSAQIADITHEIPAQDVLGGGLAVWRAARYFPEGSVHIAVVDPGVGTHRRPLAAQIGALTFVGPDNGIFTPLIVEAEQAGAGMQFIALDRPEYWLPTVSRTFHGRDIFAPVAAHLASGVPLEALGTPVDDPVRIPLPEAVRTPTGWRGQIIHIDHFGNLASNIRIETVREILKNQDKIRIRTNGVEITGIVDTFGERPAGELAALFDSAGNLHVAVVNGNASERLNARLGDAFEIFLA